VSLKRSYKTCGLLVSISGCKTGPDRLGTATEVVLHTTPGI